MGKEEEITDEVMDIIKRSMGQKVCYATSTGFCSIMFVEQQKNCIYYWGTGFIFCMHYGCGTNQCHCKEAVEEAKRREKESIE